MKLLDSIKNLFMDEVDEDEDALLEEEEKKEYKEPKDVLPKVMRDTIKKEEEMPELKMKKRNISPKKEEEIDSSPTLPKEPEKKFSFPIDFETDFVPSRKNNINVLELEREEKKKEEVKKIELYSSKKEQVKEKVKFRATPVISPVYGILDKNYKKEEVKEKPDETSIMKRPSKKVDFETVRKKAFGNLTDEIKDNMLCENCELYKEVKKMNSLNEDDLLYDMTQDDEPITIKRAYDNYEEFGVAYEPKKDEIKTADDEEATVTIESTTVKVTTVNEPMGSDDKLEVKEEKIEKIEEEKNLLQDEKVPSRQEKKREAKVDEDFFDLIDSMYKERNDE